MELTSTGKSATNPPSSRNNRVDLNESGLTGRSGKSDVVMGEDITGKLERAIQALRKKTALDRLNELYETMNCDEMNKVIIHYIYIYIYIVQEKDSRFCSAIQHS